MLDFKVFKRYFLFYFGIIVFVLVCSAIYGIVNKLKFDKFILIVVPLMAILFCVLMSLFCSYVAASAKLVVSLTNKNDIFQYIDNILSSSSYFKQSTENNITIYAFNKPTKFLYDYITLEVNESTNNLAISAPRFIIDKISKSFPE